MSASVSRWLLVTVLVLSPASLLLSLWGWRGIMLEMLAGLVVLAAARLTPGLADPDRSIATAAAGIPIFSGIALIATLFAGLAAGRTTTLLFITGLVVLGTVLPWTAASRVIRSAGARSEGSDRTLAVFGLLLAPFLSSLLAVGVGAAMRAPGLIGIVLIGLGVGGLIAVGVRTWRLTSLPAWVPVFALFTVGIAAVSALLGVVIDPAALGGSDTTQPAEWAASLGVALIVAGTPLLAAAPVAFAERRGFHRRPGRMPEAITT